jgi:hypothetical protein
MDQAMDKLLRENLSNLEIAHSSIASLRDYLKSENEIIDKLYTQAIFKLETQTVSIELRMQALNFIEEEINLDNREFELLKFFDAHHSILHTYLFSDSIQDLMENLESYRSTEFIQLLLDDPRIDPTHNSSQALLVALESGNQEAALLLRKRGCSLLTKIGPQYVSHGYRQLYKGRLPHGIEYIVEHKNLYSESNPPVHDYGFINRRYTYLNDPGRFIGNIFTMTKEFENWCVIGGDHGFSEFSNWTAEMDSNFLLELTFVP